MLLRVQRAAEVLRLLVRILAHLKVPRCGLHATLNLERLAHLVILLHANAKFLHYVLKIRIQVEHLMLSSMAISSLIAVLLS